MEKKNILKVSAMLILIMATMGLSVQDVEASTRLDIGYFLSTEYSHNILPGSKKAVWEFGSGYSCWGYFWIDWGDMEKEHVKLHTRWNRSTQNRTQQSC